MTTSRCDAQKTIRAHGSNKCSQHYGKEIIYVCENCDDLVCTECVIQQHKGHEIEGLTNIIPAEKEKLDNFVTKVEEKELPKIKKKLQDVDENMSKNNKRFQKLVEQIKKRNEILKKELDEVTNNLVKTCHDMEHQNNNTLVNYQKELQAQMDKINSTVQEIKASLQSGNAVLVYDTSHVIPSEFEDLNTPSCSTADFTAGKSALQHLENLIGELTITALHKPNLSLSQHANWRVTSEFMPYKKHTVKSMQAADDKVWLSFCNFWNDHSKAILSVNTKGQVQQTLDMEVSVSDISVSPQTGNIWFCSGEDNSIREVKDSPAQIKFKTASTPLCICVTKEDHVLVGLKREIIKYTQTGEEICKTSGKTMPPVRYISECPLTKNVAVVPEQKKNFYGSDGEPVKVLILNDQLQLLHSYSGELSNEQIPPRQFDPRGVSYTDTGELIITNSTNKSLVLVTGTGKYLQTLYTHSKSLPTAVCVHSGALWASLYDGKIQVLNGN